MKNFFVYFCLFLFCFIQNSWSDDFIINNIVINKPWIKSIHSGQKVTSGYLEIINKSKSDDVLLSIESNFAKNNQIHSMNCLLYTSPSPRDKRQSRMPSSA